MGMGGSTSIPYSLKRKKGTKDLSSALSSVQDTALNITNLITKITGTIRSSDQTGVEEDSIRAKDNNCLDMINKLEGRIKILTVDTATLTTTVSKRIKLMKDKIDKYYDQM